MRIPGFLLRLLQRWAVRQISSRPFDVLIRYADGGPHFYRWYIWGAKKEGVDKSYTHNDEVPFYLYLHIFVGDDEQDPHDHPRHNISLVLGSIDTARTRTEVHEIGGLGYWEWIKERFIWRPEGTIVMRRANTPHRVILPRESSGIVSLFFGWRKIREWGFICPDGHWVHWKTYHERDSENQERRCQ